MACLVEQHQKRKNIPFIFGRSIQITLKEIIQNYDQNLSVQLVGETSYLITE